MSDLRSELAALVADVRALLDDASLRGVRHEDVEAAPVAPAVAAAAEPVASAAPVTAVPVARAPVVSPPPVAVVPAPEPEPPRASLWTSTAATARAESVPDHHDDGHGEAGLAKIRADLGDCTRCGLCKGRKNIVFGVGDPDADLMVLGEGPGEQEDARGEPFVGPAGQMLDRMLANVVGLPREKVYIANVVKCRPPENRNPAPEEAAVCKPFLFRQIEAVRPKIMLVLGGVALEHVLGVKGITRLRGQEMPWRGVPVIPTFHPAYLLRREEDKKYTFEDLKLLKRRYDALGGRR